MGKNVFTILSVSHIVAALKYGRESGSSHIPGRELRLDGFFFPLDEWYEWYSLNREIY